MFTLPIEVSPQPGPELSAKGLDILYKTHTHCNVQQQELGILVLVVGFPNPTINFLAFFKLLFMILIMMVILMFL